MLLAQYWDRIGIGTPLPHWSLKRRRLHGESLVQSAAADGPKRCYRSLIYTRYFKSEEKVG